MKRFHLLYIYLLCTIYRLVAVEDGDGSVCFNKCNGHGTCVDYSCVCYAGWSGDDCGVTFASEGKEIVPILSAGHMNLTSVSFQSVISKNTMVLVGFSSTRCHKCISAESEYARLSESLRESKVLFARADCDNMKNIAAKYAGQSLPALVLFHNARPYLYKGAHSFEAIQHYIDKVLAPIPMKILASIDEVKDFMSTDRKTLLHINSVNVIGFFSSHNDMEEDEYEEFREVAKILQFSEDTYCAVVTNSKVSKYFIREKVIDRTPSVVLMGETGSHSINMNELDGDMGLQQWVQAKALPLVGKMTPQSFLQYEKTGLPMLMMFLDLAEETAASQPGIVGGRSGGILNQILIDECRDAAKEHIGRILFVYLDGITYADQMKSLGLLGGAERLPSIAFNTKDSLQITFPETLPINSDTINRFCADFINGKLRTKAEAKKFAERALQASNLNTKNKAVRKARKKSPPVEKGIAETYDAEYDAKGYISVVTPKNFDVIAMEEGRDVVLMLHSEGCEPCAHFAVYYKRVAERFKDLNIPSLRIARMDVTRETPPPQLRLMGTGTLPTVVILPAYSKHEPWSYYSGVGKPQEIMRWIQTQAEIPFHLPNLPHLSDEQKVLYKEQIREREDYLDAKKRQEEEDMLREEQEREAYLRKKANRDVEVSVEEVSNSVGLKSEF